MKKITILFCSLGFVFEVAIPILLFGIVVPYTHGTLEAGLTSMGWFALILIALIAGRKIKKSAEKLPKSLFRGILLTVFRVIRWVIIVIAAEYLLDFAVSFVSYLSKAVYFVIIGWIFYLIDDITSGGDEE